MGGEKKTGKYIVPKEKNSRSGVDARAHYYNGKVRATIYLSRERGDPYRLTRDLLGDPVLLTGTSGKKGKQRRATGTDQGRISPGGRKLMQASKELGGDHKYKNSGGENLGVCLSHVERTTYAFLSCQKNEGTSLLT